MKACIRCGLLFDETHGKQKYCFDCAYVVDLEKRRNNIREKRKYNPDYERTLGNPKQDEQILKFLREKRKRDDKKYNK